MAIPLETILKQETFAYEPFGFSLQSTENMMLPFFHFIRVIVAIMQQITPTKKRNQLKLRRLRLKSGTSSTRNLNSSKLSRISVNDTGSLLCVRDIKSLMTFYQASSKLKVQAPFQAPLIGLVFESQLQTLYILLCK